MNSLLRFRLGDYYDRNSKISSYHVISDNHILYEHTREDESNVALYPVGCIFKSLLSVLVGIAIEEKKIYSVNDCVIDYLPHEDVENIEWYSLHINHVLSKTTGIKWPGPFDITPETSDDINCPHPENKEIIHTVIENVL